MKLETWRSFSANNSGASYLVAEFDRTEMAEFVADELRAFIEAVESEHADGDGEGKTQAQKELEDRVGVDLGSVAWNDDIYGEDESPTVAALGNRVAVYHDYCDGLSFFAPIAKAYEGRVVVDRAGAPRVAVTYRFSADSDTARAEMSDYFRNRGSEYWQWDAPPWNPDGELAVTEEDDPVAWWFDGTCGGFVVPVDPKDFSAIKGYFEGPGFEEFAINLEDAVAETRVRDLADLGDCPECAEPVRFAAADSTMEEDQLICTACGGMFALSVMKLHSPITRLETGALKNPEREGDAVWVPASDGSIWRFADGDWDKKTTSSCDLYGVHCGAERFVAPGSKGGRGVFMTSTDRGESWQLLEIKTPGTIYSVAEQVGGVLFASAENGVLLRSDDGGATWDQVKTPTRKSLFDVAAGPKGQLLACGSGGVILSSADGETWRVVKTPISAPLCRIEFFNKGAVIVGDEGAILASEDGMKFDVIDAGIESDLDDLIIDEDNVLHAVSADGYVYSSTDGRSWQKKNSRSRVRMWGIGEAADGRLMCVGEAGVVAWVRP